MHRFFSLVTRFGRDERGVFAVLFGLMAVVLIALGGAVVDYVSLEQARNRSQIALDSATLALQPMIFETPINVNDIKVKAQALLRDRIGIPAGMTANEFGVEAEVTDARVNLALGSLSIDARIWMPTMFVSLVGVPQMDARMTSQATRRMLDVEVMMVLDNSGSMGGTPMANLKTAACNAVNILFYDRDGLGCVVPGGLTPNPNVRMGVVPFTSLVNVGAHLSNQLWLDWTSESHLAVMGYIPNFDNDDNEATPFTGPVDRRTLFSQTRTSWQGCVEARMSPYDTTDDPPDIAARKFVPLFTPDTYNTNNNYITDDSGSACFAKTCSHAVTRSCTGNKTGCTGPQTNSYTRSAAGVTSAVATSCIPSGASAISNTTTYPNNSTQVITRVYNIPLTNREAQDRVCKYQGKSLSNSNTNANCPSAAILPLTATPSAVLTRVNAMVADGNTNIQQGAVWGMHALTSGQPLIEALPQAPGQVAKIMIVMTDGKNEPSLISSTSDMNGSAYYSWGFRYDGRLGPKASVDTANEVTTIMDDRTKAACEYAKQHRGIEIYTIGLGASTATKVMLTACASSASHAYFPANPSQLNAVFRAIAANLAALRLSQ